MKTDYRALVSSLLSFTISEAKGKSAHAVLSLAQALEAVATELREHRLEMREDFECQCSDCGRPFALNVSIAHERLHGMPDNCIPCFESKPGKVSGLRPFFRYIDKKAGIPHGE